MKLKFTIDNRWFYTIALLIFATLVYNEFWLLATIPLVVMVAYWLLTMYAPDAIDWKWPKDQ